MDSIVRSIVGTATAYGVQTAYPSSGTSTAYPGSSMSGSATAFPGTATGMGGGFGTELNLGEIGHARKTMMGVKLDQAGEDISGRQKVDVKGYLTDLASVTPRNANSIGDIKKGRMLLTALKQSNPKHAPAWIASAGLEEADGKLTAARNIIIKGTEMCPQSEDVWLEAIRLMEPDEVSIV